MRVPAALVLILLAACAAGPLTSRASAADLWVGGNQPGCSDALAPAAVTTSALTWCTLGGAAKVAAPGDTVHVLAAQYRETVRFYTSGTPAAPIRVVAAQPGVVVDAAGAGQALKLMDVSDVELSGLRVTGASAQGIWVQGGARVHLIDLDIAATPGVGVTIKGTADLNLQESTGCGSTTRRGSAASSRTPTGSAPATPTRATSHGPGTAPTSRAGVRAPARTRAA